MGTTTYGTRLLDWRAKAQSKTVYSADFADKIEWIDIHWVILRQLFECKCLSGTALLYHSSCGPSAKGFRL